MSGCCCHLREMCGVWRSAFHYSIIPQECDNFGRGISIDCDLKVLEMASERHIKFFRGSMPRTPLEARSFSAMPLLTPFFVLLTGLESLLIKQLVHASAVRMSRD